MMVNSENMLIEIRGLKQDLSELRAQINKST